jgi:hypothetical protein
MKKKGMTAEALLKLLIWIIFAAVIFSGIKYLLKRTGVWG